MINEPGMWIRVFVHFCFNLADSIDRMHVRDS